MFGVPEKTLYNPAELETSKSLRDFNSNIPEPPQLERANHEQKVANHAQTIHVGEIVHIYHQFSGKCGYIIATWIVWDI